MIKIFGTVEPLLPPLRSHIIRLMMTIMMRKMILYDLYDGCNDNHGDDNDDFNPFAPEPPVTARNRPCGSTSFLPFVTSSVLTVKDNFVR